MVLLKTWTYLKITCTVSGSCMLGHSQSVSARSCTEPSRRRAGWKVTQWHLTRAFIAVESVRELNVMMAFGYLLHRTPVYRQLMAAMLLHFASPNVFNAATSAIATLIANNSESHVSTRCAEMQLWSTSVCLSVLKLLSAACNKSLCYRCYVYISI